MDGPYQILPLQKVDGKPHQWASFDGKVQFRKVKRVGAKFARSAQVWIVAPSKITDEENEVRSYSAPGFYSTLKEAVQAVQCSPVIVRPLRKRIEGAGFWSCSSSHFNFSRHKTLGWFIYSVYHTYEEFDHSYNQLTPIMQAWFASNALLDPSPTLKEAVKRLELAVGRDSPQDIFQALRTPGPGQEGMPARIIIAPYLR